MRQLPWYEQYDELRTQVEERKNQFHQQCTLLGMDEDIVWMATREDIVARAVHESNRQEGLYLDIPRTKELRTVAFTNLGAFAGPDVNMPEFIEEHRRAVIKLKRRRASIEEIASYNLSSAFLAIHWISQAFTARESAAWTQTILAFLHTKDRADWPQTSALLQQDETFRQLLEQLPQELEDLTRSTEPTVFPATRGILTEGELWNALLQMEYQDPRHLELMHVDYIHFLHRVVMMGILPTRYCGAFRTTPVQVGDPRVTFAPPAFIADLMDNFCRSFPRVIPISENYDPILSAAPNRYTPTI